MKYPDGQFDVEFVGKYYFFFEIAGIDGGVLILIELVVDVFERDGCFANSACVDGYVPSPSTTILNI